MKEHIYAEFIMKTDCYFHFEIKAFVRISHVFILFVYK